MMNLGQPLNSSMIINELFGSAAEEPEFLGFLALFYGLIFAFIFLFNYLYMAFAFMYIGKKARLNEPRLSWIPFLGPMIIAMQAAKMHWWPLILFCAGNLTMLAGFILLFNVSAISGILILIIGYILLLISVIYYFVWQWKMLEAIGKPGWWVLMILIPQVGVIIYYVFIGLAAWSKN